MNKERIQFIDIARGIAIICVIIGHVFLFGLTRNVIYTFHVPLFIIASGYFFKEKKFKDEIKNLFFKLFLPTTIILFAVCLIKNMANMGILDSIWSSLKSVLVCWSRQKRISANFKGTSVLWFVYILIIIRLLFVANKKIAKDNNIRMIALIVIEFLLGYFLGIMGYWLPWSLDVALTCVVFYYVGYLLSKNNLLEKVTSDKLSMFFLFVVWLFGVPALVLELANRYYTGLVGFVIAIAATIIIFKISMFISNKTKVLNKFLSWCGEYSLYILLGHFIEDSLFRYNFGITNTTLNTVSIILFKCLFSLVFAFVIVNIKKLTKKKLR